MPDPPGPPTAHPGSHAGAAGQSTGSPASNAQDDRMRCDRCHAEMFRMHAVWRCPSCGFKTDCCGW